MKSSSWPPWLVGLFILTSHVTDAAAQGTVAIEARGGLVHSAAFAEGIAVVPDGLDNSAEAVRIGPGLAPFADLSLLRRVDPLVVAELTVGASVGTVRGEGPAGSWDSGTLVTLHALVGVRIATSVGIGIRLGAGKAAYSADDVHLLEGGANTGILLSVGGVYDPPRAGPLAITVDLQRHGFGSTPLRTAGAPDGSLVRSLFGISVPVWGQP